MTNKISWFEKNTAKTIMIFIVFILGCLELFSFMILMINDKIIHGVNFTEAGKFQKYDSHLLYNYKPNKNITLRNWENNSKKSNPIKWSFDEYGFVKTSKPKYKNRDKNKPPIKVALFGGSTVFGVGATSIHHTIASYLQTSLNENNKNINFEVINAGVRGYFSYFEYLKYLNHVRPLQPDIIIDLNGRNDIYLILKKKLYDEFRTNHSKHLESKINEKNIFKKYIFPLIEETLEYSNFFIFLERIYGKFFKNFIINRNLNSKTQKISALDKNDLKKRLNNYIYIMNNFQSSVENDNKRFYWFLQPVGHLYKTLSEEEKNLIKTPWTLEIDKYKHNLLFSYNYISEKKLNLIDLSKLFIDNKRNIYIDDVHYNNTGNRLIAKKISEHILNDY